MEETIDSEMSGDLREGLQTLIKCIRDQNKFLADKLQVVLHGKDTKTATRIILGEVNSILVFVVGRIVMFFVLFVVPASF